MADVWDMIAVSCGGVGVVAGDEVIQRICFEASLSVVEEKIQTSYPDLRRSVNPLLESALHQLTEYFSGDRQFFELPLEFSNLTDFNRKVLSVLDAVPYGQTVSYGRLAAMAGFPAAARATGHAMAVNPFPIVLPCHRVIRANGQPGRYSAACGTQTKQWLLDFELQQLA